MDPPNKGNRADLSTLPDYIAHQQLQPLIDALRYKKKIVIIAGAGISASAGIPTFEDTPKARDLFDRNSYRSSGSTLLLNQKMLEIYRRAINAIPTKFHSLIAAIAEEGRLLRLYTQNIDGIDTSLPSLKTRIPLEEPWPICIQLHGTLRMARCELRSDSHLYPIHSDPRLYPSDAAIFGPEPLYCTYCEDEEEKRSKEGKRARGQGILRPRVWLYNDYGFPDKNAIGKVTTEDILAIPDAVIVVGTALKVPYAKLLARDMCREVRKAEGFTAWINLKDPPQDLDFSLAVIGDCDTVAKHVSSWWLKWCPSLLSDTEIQEVQKKCNLFIARSPEAALNRAFSEVDDDSLSKMLQQEKNKSRILNIKENGHRIFIAPERYQTNSKVIKQNVEIGSHRRKNPPLAPTSVPSESLDILPNLPDCWEMEMSKRLGEVIVQQTIEGRKSSSVVTKVTDLGYREKLLEASLWRLKPGECLNSEILNAYLGLLRESKPANVDIQGTDILNVDSKLPLRRLNKVIETGTYSIFIPVHEGNHWTFAVLTSKNKDETVRWEYYDSLGGEPPQKLLSWLKERLPKATLERVIGSPSPRQRNGVDCGLFMLMGIRLISAGGQHLSQAQSDIIISTFRQRVLAELLASKLNPSSSDFEEFKRKEAHTDIILPQANLGKKVCDKSIYSTGDQSHQVDGLTEYNSSRLFVSPYPDNGGDTETDSLYVLSESEEELVQVKSSTQRVSRTKKSPEQIAFAFAQEASMVKILREAVLIERASHKGPKLENMQLADLWLMISTEKRTLKQRYVHYEFSRQFWAEMDKLERSPRQRGPVPKATISEVMSKLEITNQTNWKYILQQARRASVWTELVDIFKGDLKHPSVVLCAIPDATYTLETMTLTNRKVFFEAIRSRVKESGGRILARLQAADDLHWAVLHNNLPVSDLPIETYSKDLPFEDTVRLENKHS